MKAENFSETFNQEVADRYHSLATLSFPSKGGLISEGRIRSSIRIIVNLYSFIFEPKVEKIYMGVFSTHFVPLISIGQLLPLGLAWAMFTASARVFSLRSFMSATMSSNISIFSMRQRHLRTPMKLKNASTEEEYSSFVSVLVDSGHQKIRRTCDL